MDSAAVFLGWAQVIAGVATAATSIALVYFAWVTVRRASEPHIVATLEPNEWAINLFDIIVANTGNAAAYDVTVDFDPPLPARDPESKRMPLKTLTVLKPGQHLTSFVGEHQKIKGQDYRVKTTWRRSPGKGRVEANEYSFNIDQFSAVSRLNDGPPLYRIATQLTKMQEDWRSIATGFKRLKINVYTSEDRDEENRDREARFAQWKAEQDAAQPKVESDVTPSKE